MASQNEVFICGFLEDDVISQGNQQIFVLVTRSRYVTNTFYGKHQRIFVRYDMSENDRASDALHNTIAGLKRGDVVLLKGVFNITVVNKPITCKHCSMRFIKPYTTAVFVYPISVNKIDTLEEWAFSTKDKAECAKLLFERYREISNNISIMGRVIKSPEIVNKGNAMNCRYQITIDRKYYIKTQSDITYDNPFIYSYGEQALSDMKYLKKGTTVQVNGLIRTREVPNKAECPFCGNETVFQDKVTDIIAYSVEYLRSYNKFDDEGNLLEDLQAEFEEETDPLIEN